MNWNDCEAVWKSQELPVGSAAEVAALKATFEARRRKMAASLFVRDLLEGSTGPLVCLALALFGWQTGRWGWPMELAILLVLVVSGVFLRERFRARRGRLSAEAPLLAKVEADIAELQNQRRLLLTMRTWYLGPVFAVLLTVPAVVYLLALSSDPKRGALFNAGFAGLYLLLSGFAWVMNRREVRKRLNPRLEELKTLRRGLVAGG